MGQITEDFIQRAMRCCQLGQHPSLTVWETRQLLTAWVEWQGCRDERDKLDEANRVCEQWRQWTVATRAENETLRARVAELEAALGELVRLKALKESRYALACLEVTDAERAEVRANLAEYREKKEAAWDAARAAMRLAGNKPAVLDLERVEIHRCTRCGALPRPTLMGRTVCPNCQIDVPQGLPASAPVSLSKEES